MKKLISCTALLLIASLAVSLAAPSSDALEAKEKAAWQSFKDKKTDDFKKLVSPNLVSVYAEGVSDLQGELDAMGKWDMKSFAISDYKVTMYGADTAISTYRVKVDGTLSGKDMSGTHNCASVWQMKNGQWQGIFHTDVKAAAPDTQ